MKIYTKQEARNLLGSLRKDPRFLRSRSHKNVTIAGARADSIKVYMTRRSTENRWNLSTFSDDRGSGYVIFTGPATPSLKSPIKNNHTMAEKRVSRKTAMSSCGTHLKKGYKFKKGGVVVKVTADKKKPAKPARRKK